MTDLSAAQPSMFRLERPALRGPVVVEVPHAGTLVDPVAARFVRAPERAIVADADVAADQIFADAPDVGAALVVATVSRFVIDLNTRPRVPSPYDDKLPPGLREVRRRSVSGLAWFEDPPPREEVERRIAEVVEPYHAAIAALLSEAREARGAAILVSAHSYPDSMFPGKADVVVGTRRGESAGAEARDAVVRAAAAHGLSVGLDDPFPGGWALERHARRDDAIQGVQIEIARRLYCDPDTFTPRPGDVARLRAFGREVMARLSDVVSRSIRPTP